jgi:TRAP transporter TAXI family solute receptor
VLFAAASRLSAAETRRLGALVREHAGRLGQRAGMRLLAGSAGGASHAGVAAIAGLVRERLPDLRLVKHEMHGRRNLTALENGQAAYCTAVLGSLEAAFLGAAPHGRPHARLRLVAALASQLLHIVVRADSPARTFRDLLGARVSAGERDYATAHAFTQLAALRSRSARELERSLARMVYLDYVEAHREFEAGKIDALASLDSVANPAYLRIARAVPLRLLSLDDELLARFTGKERFYSAAEIPAGAYPGCPAARTVRTSLVMVATEDRPEAEVREFLAAIHDGRQRLTETAPGFAVTPPPACSVPLHPGARRYWGDPG